MKACRVIPIIAMTLAVSASLGAGLSSSAYRVLGQPDLRQDGANGVQGTELFGPGAVALAASGGQGRVYSADSQNHRILAWADAATYQNGDRPALVLGQPGFTSANPMGLSYKGLNTPSGLAVDPASGDLYVADTGNHRLLRFADPFSNPSRVEPEAVYGQPNFQTLGAKNNSSAVANTGLKSPQALAFDTAGNLWVADTGNHRVLRYPAGSLHADKPAPDAVLGQADFSSALPNRGGAVAANTLYAPAGLALDAQGALYIADFNNARVVKSHVPATDAA